MLVQSGLYLKLDVSPAIHRVWGSGRRSCLLGLQGLLAAEGLQLSRGRKYSWSRALANGVQVQVMSKMCY